MLTPAHQRNARRPRGGFTFIEVMFAVLVLGVGVIMIAAMLPVAIRTAQETRDNAAGSAAIESGFHAVEQSYADTGTEGLPPTVTLNAGGFEFTRPWTWPYRADDWPAADLARIPDYYAIDVANGVPSPRVGVLQRTFGSRIVSSDPTLMWIPFVARGDDVEPPQVAMVAVRSRNIDQFPTSVAAGVPEVDFFPSFHDVSTFPADIANPAFRRMDNHALPVSVATHGGRALIDGVPSLEDDDIAKISGRAGLSNQQVREAAVEGAALVLVDPQGRLRVYRLAAPLTADDANPAGDGPTTWVLLPDAGLRPNAVRVIVNDPGNPDDDEFFSADAWNSTGTPFNPFTPYLLSERDDFIANQAPFVSGYLIGRGLENEDVANVAAPDGWDDEDNPYVGPTQVVRHLDGKPIR